MVLQVALKCADVGHLAAPRSVHWTWVQLLEEEFFRQVSATRCRLRPAPPQDRSLTQHARRWTACRGTVNG